MELECPSCGVRYIVPADRWPMAPDDRGMATPKAARARCKACGHVWLATPEEPLIELDTPVEPLATHFPPAAPRLAPPAPAARGPALPRPAEQRTAEAANDDPAPEDAPPRRRGRWLLAGLGATAAVAAGAWAALAMGLVDPQRLGPLPVDLPEVTHWEMPALPAIAIPALRLPTPPAPALGISADAIARPLATGGQVWEISGEVRNPGTARQPVPPLEVLLVDSAGLTLARWTVAPPAGSLAPGAALAFETSAVNPPAGAARVAVRLKPVALARL